MAPVSVSSTTVKSEASHLGWSPDIRSRVPAAIPRWGSRRQDGPPEERCTLALNAATASASSSLAPRKIKPPPRSLCIEEGAIGPFLPAIACYRRALFPICPLQELMMMALAQPGCGRWPHEPLRPELVYYAFI